MAKEKKETYGFLSKLVVTLMSEDKLFTYAFLKTELQLSPKMLSRMKRGEDAYIYQYVRLLSFLLNILNLKFMPEDLWKELKLALTTRCDLVVAVVPHHSCGTVQPKHWTMVMEWDGVEL